MTHISMIAAMANNRVIGKDNQMPWHLPADLAHFKKVTLAKSVIMGRKTHESIGMLLPGRKNIIITRNKDYQVEGATVVNTVEQALDCVESKDEAMIIGGANIYRQLLGQAHRLYLTFIDLDVEGDAHFPDWQEYEWQEISREQFQPNEKNPYRYQFVTLERKNLVA